MIMRKTDDPTPGAEWLDETERQDWNRYGLAPRPDVDAPVLDAAPRTPKNRSHSREIAARFKSSSSTREPALETPRRTADPDEFFLDYRDESHADEHGPAGRSRSPRFVANLVTVSVVGVIGVVVMVIAIVSSAIWPAPPPTPTRSATQFSDSSVSIVPGASSTTRMAHTGIAIDLPMDITIADRDQPPDDGGVIYLTGPTGGVAVDPGTGAFKHVYGGLAFAGGLGRAFVMDGLWVSSASSDEVCGPNCWAESTTYRLDRTSGAVTQTFPQTYLVGAASDGVWVATGNRLERLDPSTGDALATVPWSRSAEPRFGCGSIWAFTAGDSGATIAEIDPSTGRPLGQSRLDPMVADGPTYVEGQCWMMSGSAGVSGGTTTLVWLNVDGTTAKVFRCPGRSILTLDREFWGYSQDGKLRRFEAVSGIDYGVAYVLPIKPTDNDPKWIFAAAGTLWMLQGGQLVGFDVPTGTNRANG